MSRRRIKRPVGMLLAAGAIACSIGARAGLVPGSDALSPESERAGDVLARVRCEYAARDRAMFGNAANERELWRVPRVTFAIGMADGAELVLDYCGLLLKRDGESFELGTGDLTVAGLYELAGEDVLRPAVSLVVATKLPNAKYEGGFGTDQTDFYAGGAFSKRMGELLTVTANALLGILENPAGDVPEQDDVLVYNLAFSYRFARGFAVVFEADGIFNSHFQNDRACAELGVTWETRYGVVELKGGTGLNGKSGGMRVAIGFVTGFGAVKAGRAP